MSSGGISGQLESTWIALEAFLGDKVGVSTPSQAMEYPKPWSEYPTSSLAKAMGGSLRQSREDPGHMLGSFWEAFGVEKGLGKRLRSIPTEF